MSLPIPEKKKRIPTYQEVMGEKTPTKIPTYDEVMGEKKNPIGNDLNNGSQPSPDLNQEIPQVDLDEPLQGSDNAEGNAPADANDIISQAKYANNLSGKTKQVSVPSSGKGGQLLTDVPDEDALNYSKKIKEDLNTQGYDADKLGKDFKDVPDYVYNIPELTKPELLKAYKDNPQLYERKVATANWQPALLNNLEKEKIPEQFQDVKLALHNIANPDLDLQTKRNNINNIVSVINQHGGDKKEDMLNHLSVELSNVYGEAATKPDSFKDDPLSAQLNSNQLAAYHWMQDTKPKEFQQYQSALLDDKDIKGNFDAQLSKDEAGKKLDEMGIMLQKSYAQEHLNPVLQEYNKLLTKSQIIQDLTPEEQNRVVALEQAGKPYVDVLNSAASDEKTLNERYPKSSSLDANNFAQELLGQKHTGLDWLAIETGKATQNTAKGISDFASELFNSDKENQINQAEILGSNSLSENSAYLKQENQTTKTFKPTVSKELQTDIDGIKNDDNLNNKQKLDKVNDLLLHRPGEWQRTPIDNQTNIGLTSLMYGVGGMAANLAPFMATEMLTGGGATASALRKFTSAFTSAAATGFHESYIQALKDGEQNPFATAMRRTAINSAAMAGADTPGAIKKMLGGKTAIGKLVEKMTDTEIEAALKQEPKALGIFKKSVQAIKGVGKNVLDNTATAAKVSAFTTGGQVANDAIDNKLKSPEDYLKEAAISTLKFATLGTVLGAGSKALSKPTDINLGALTEAAKNPEGFLRSLEVMEKNGTITPKDAAQVRNNIDKVSKIYEKSAILKSDKLSDPDKREYLHNALIKMDAMEAEGSLPPRQAAEALKKAMVADHKNGILLDNPTDKQLESKKNRLEGILEPKKDDKGEVVELPEKIKKDAEGELEAVNDTIDERSAKVAHEKAKKFVDTKLSQPIEGVDEQGIPTGDNVPAPTNISSPNTIENGKDNQANNAQTEGRQNVLDNNAAPDNSGAAITDKTISNEKANKVSDTETPGSTSNESPDKVIGTTEGGEEKNTVGIRHESLSKIADRIGLEQPAKGDVLTTPEYIERGRQLLKAGADVDKVAEDFENDGKISADTVSVARAHVEQLTKDADKARIDFGKDSKQYKEAKQKLEDFNNNVAKPMGTKWGEIGRTMMGETDLDTGSYIATEKAVEDKTGKPVTPKQSKDIEALTGKVGELNNKINDLQDKLSEALDKISSEENKSPKSIKERSKNVAKAIRKGKLSRPDTFSAASPASLVWDGALEVAAKTVEGAGTIAQAISDGLKHIQESDWYKSIAADKKKEAEKGFEDYMNDNFKNNDILTRFADKKDSDFTTDEVKDIWEYAKKQYIDKGENVNSMIKKVSFDLGLTSKQVLDALEKPKGIKNITNEMYVLQNRRTSASNQVKEMVQNANQGNVVKWLKAIPNFFFQKAIFGHGTVGMITHAGMNIFDPTIAKIYWPLFFKQFKNAFGSLSKSGLADYEKSMQHLVNDPLFITAKRAGLKVDPTETNDDYAGMKRFLGKVGAIGDRGFNTLKEFRLAFFKNEYNKLPDSLKNDPEVLQEIAKAANHSSGTADFKPNGFLNTAVFAPRLEASKWARVITSPAKALITLSKWNEATPAEKTQAKMVARRSGIMVGTYLSGLAINQAFLSTSGSNQKINFTDPTKKDWLKYKVDDEVIDMSGGIIPTTQFIGHLLYLPFESQDELGKQSRSDALMKTGYDYAMSKLSPVASTAKDAVTAHDFQGNTMPWSDDKPKTKYNHKLTWKEYIFNSQAPIPVAEATRSIYEAMKEKGLSEPQIGDIFIGIVKGVISGGTGTKVVPDYSVKDSGKDKGANKKTHTIGRVHKKTLP